jgi:hypothetical protein
MAGNNFSGQLVRQHDDNERYTFVRISSKERKNGNPYNFVANFGNDVKLDNITEIHLMQASIPNVMNNVSADIGNNTFTYTGTVSGAQQVLFTDGFYTTNQIMARLQSEMNIAIAPSTVSVVQNAITGKITFTITGAETITYDNTGLNFTIGFTSSIGPIGAVSAQSLPSLNGSTLFYVHSTEMSNNNTILISGGSNIEDVNGAFTIPVNVPFGVYQNYTGNENLDRIVFGRTGRSLRNFRITTRTNGGRLATEITDNFEIVLVLKVLYN